MILPFTQYNIRPRGGADFGRTRPRKITAMKLELILSGVATAAAVTSVLLALRSNSISARALRLAELNRSDRDQSVLLYVIDSFLLRNRSEETVSFALSLINRSDTANSVVRMDLEVHYVLDNGTVGHLLFPSREFTARARDQYGLKSICVPIPLAARGTHSGWMSFVVPRDVARGAIDHYCLVATTAVGERVVNRCYLIREVCSEVADVS